MVHFHNSFPFKVQVSGHTPYPFSGQTQIILLLMILIYIYIFNCLSIYLSIYLNIYIYMCVCVFIYIHHPSSTYCTTSIRYLSKIAWHTHFCYLQYLIPLNCWFQSVFLVLHWAIPVQLLATVKTNSTSNFWASPGHTIGSSHEWYP